ncbi:MAG: hypothetical protein BGP01_03355 [Paludibacter sp. 47-17]|jgi:hypothetical protein|nr:MAG: hypothetical protein BGP01_03355 [Paludibacter sp. 47-17]
MNNEQLKQLLELYKKAVAKRLSADDFVKEIQATQIQIDRSFVQAGKEDANLGEYLEELNQLQNSYINE